MSKIAILGYGVVGSGVYEVIRTNAESIARKSGRKIDIKYILDLRDFDDHPEKELFTKDFQKILKDAEVDIVAEVIGGARAAYTFTKEALLAGKSVVTSNKELVATHGAELLNIAIEKGVSYLFEASVGGGIPIIRPLHQCLAANEITEILGILNGTTNYILTQMVKEGKDFEVALKDAQKKGYAEADPTADIEGIDACRKIAILSSLAYGKQVDADKVDTQGISGLSLTDVAYAEKMGYVIKLIGHSLLENGHVMVYVSPMLVPLEHSLAGVDDVFNAIMVKGNAIGDVMFYGRGAGKLPTASAVVADIIDIASNGKSSKPIRWETAEKDYMLGISENNSLDFVRAGISQQEKVQELFGGVGIITLSEKPDEFGFITPKMKEKELNKKLAQMEDVRQVIRLIENN